MKMNHCNIAFLQPFQARIPACSGISFSSKQPVEIKTRPNQLTISQTSKRLRCSQTSRIISPSCSNASLWWQRKHSGAPAKTADDLSWDSPLAVATVKNNLERCRYVVYTLIPLISAGILPFPCFAEGEQGAAAVGPDTSDNFLSDMDNSPASRILGIFVLILLVYASVGVVIVSINNFLLDRNDKDQTKKVKEILEKHPKTKLLSPFVNKKGEPSTSSTSPLPSGNREQRRMEKKLKDKEAREKKRREEKIAARKAESERQKKS